MDQSNGLESQKEKEIAQYNQRRSSGEIIITSIFIPLIRMKNFKKRKEKGKKQGNRGIYPDLTTKSCDSAHHTLKMVLQNRSNYCVGSYAAAMRHDRALVIS